MQLEIKVIQVETVFKALILDMGKADNRLVEVIDAPSPDLAWDLAEAYVKAQGLTVWH